MDTKSEEMYGIIAIVVLVVILYIGHNFLGNIKAAPITLVPTGSQAAVNPASAATLAAATAAAQATATAQAQAAATAAAAGGNATTDAILAGVGGIVGGLISGSSDDSGDEEDLGYGD